MLKVNLQPKITLEVKEGVKISIWWAVVLILVGAAYCGASYFNLIQSDGDLDAQIKSQDFKLRNFQATIEEYEQATSEKEYLQGKRDFVNGISQNQKLWIDLFDQLRDKMPKDVWLTKFSGNRNGAFSMEGSTYTFASVGFMMLQMKSIPHITTVSLDQTSGNVGKQGGDIAEALTKKFKISGNMALKTEEERKKAASGSATGTQRMPGAPGVPQKPGEPAAPLKPGAKQGTGEPI